MENKKNEQAIVEIFISEKDGTDAFVLNGGCLGFWVVFLFLFSASVVCVSVCVCL